MADDREETKKKPEPRPRPTPRQSFQRFIMIFLGILAIYVLIFPDVGRSFGLIAGAILEPFIGFGGRYPVITVLLAGLVTTTASSVLRHIFTPWMRMAKMNATMGSIRKAQMEAFRKQNTSRVQKLRARQSEIMVEYQDVQFVPLKLMAYTMFFFVVIFTWLRLFVDETLAVQGNLYFAVPWSFNAHLLGVYVFPSWILLYSLLAIPFGQVVQRVLKYITFRRRLQALGEITETTAPEDEAYEKPAEAAADDPLEEEESDADEESEGEEEADEGDEESADEDRPEDEDADDRRD